MLKRIALRKVLTRARAGRFVRDEKGVSAVEFALISAVVMTLMLGVMDYAFAIFSRMEMVSAVRSGAQYALVDSDILANITSAVEGSTNLDDTYLTVTTTEFCECSGTTEACTDSCTTDTMSKFIQIDASYDYQPIFLPNVLTVTTSTTIRVE